MKEKKVNKNGISVVIPTFNRAQYLYATLICLCNQKVAENVNYEIIVVDSGDDETDKIVQLFQNAKKVPIIYKKIKKCRNRSLVRNAGAELSNYSILCFLDNDMLTPPNFIQTHFEKHQEKEKLVLLGCRKSLLNFDITQIGEEALQTHFEILEGLPYYTDERLRLFNQNAPWRFVFSHTMSVKKEDFYNAGQFNVDFGEHWGFEDLELGFNLHLFGCQIELLTNQFTFHQPHFEQSNKEQHEMSHNADLFIRLHNCYECELYECFYTSFDEYYPVLTNLKKQFKLPSKAEQKEYDLILACLFDASENVPYKNMQLGAYCMKEDNSCKKVLLNDIFFDLPIVIQMSIISESFRVSKSVYIKNTDIVKIRKIQSISKKAGLELEYKIENDVVLLTKVKEIDSDLFIMLIPDIFAPEKRYVYSWLAAHLLKNGTFVNIRDMKKTEKLCYDDFYLPDDEQKLIEQNMDRCFGKTKLQFINSLAMLLVDSSPAIPNSKRTFIIHDEDYRLIFESLKYRKFNNVNHFDISVFDTISFLSVYNITRQVMENAKEEVRKNSFCCFMENGFLEDGIDLVLNSFSKFVKQNKDAKLTIKMPDYQKFTNSVFSLHNDISKESKLFANFQKRKMDIVQLKRAIQELCIEANIEIIQKNHSISEVIELINQNETLLFASRGVAVYPQVYIALLLGKRTVIGQHHMILNVLQPFCSVVESVPYKFANAMGVPTSCMNISYLAYTMNFEQITKALTEDKEKINDESINFIEAEAYKIIETYFVRK